MINKPSKKPFVRQGKNLPPVELKFQGYCFGKDSFGRYLFEIGDDKVYKSLCDTFNKEDDTSNCIKDDTFHECHMITGRALKTIKPAEQEKWFEKVCDVTCLIYRYKFTQEDGDEQRGTRMQIQSVRVCKKQPERKVEPEVEDEQEGEDYTEPIREAVAAKKSNKRSAKKAKLVDDEAEEEE